MKNTMRHDKLVILTDLLFKAKNSKSSEDNPLYISKDEAKVLEEAGAKKSKGFEGGTDGETTFPTQKYNLQGFFFKWKGDSHDEYF